MRRIHLVLVLLATVLGCASASTVPRPSSRPADSYRNVLTGDEIRAANGRTARDAIEVLRPWFLNLRGGSKLPLYVNGNRFDDIRDLLDVAAEVIVEIRRLNSAEATFRFGSGHPVGAPSGRPPRTDAPQLGDEDTADSITAPERAAFFEGAAGRLQRVPRIEVAAASATAPFDLPSLRRVPSVPTQRGTEMVPRAESARSTLRRTGTFTARIAS